MLTCPICGRLLGDVNIDDHHLIPKAFKGRATIKLHRICHRKIHSVFTERELLRTYNTVEAIINHDDMRTFISWVARKDPGYYAGSDDSNSRKAKRRR